jgi:hypothetical protein
MMRLIRLAMIIIPIAKQLMKLRQQYRAGNTNTNIR